MSMEEWPDNRLDDLFRKSAEEYDAPFNSADWADMDRRLAEHDRQTLFDRISRWGGVWALLLLLLTGTSWLVYKPVPGVAGADSGTVTAKSTNPQTQKSKPIHGVRTAAQVANEPASGPERDETAAGESQENEQPANAPTVREATHPAEQETTKTTDNQPVTLKNELRTVLRVLRVDRQTAQRNDRLPRYELPADRPVLAKQKAASGRGRGILPAEKKSIVDVAASSATQRRIRRTAVSPISKVLVMSKSKPVYPAGRTVNPDFSSADQAAAADLPGQPLPANLPAPGGTPNAQPADEGQWLPAISPVSSSSGLVQSNLRRTEPDMTELPASSPARQGIPRLTGLSVYLFAAPDLSSIGLKNFYRPGSNVGLAVQYQLTDRLSINVGAMYSTKRYRGHADEYVLPWKWEVLPTEVNGVCTMIDVPVNLRYDWLLQPRGDGRAPARWFVSAGATSYFVQRETYAYDYEDPTNPKIKFWSWDSQKAGKPGGSFSLSNLNISIGYERPITNRLSWQVEPFMKIPLKEIGFLRVRLLSTGAFVGLRYRL